MPGQTFTSYQYKKKDFYTQIHASLQPLTSGTSFEIELYGSDTVGGERIFLGSVIEDFSGNVSQNYVEDSGNYTYYNFKVTNVGSVKGETLCFLGGD